MARPKKCRKVCSMPKNAGFSPVGSSENDSLIVMTVDEYETIRLIDKEGFSQETCGAHMKVARTTVQQMYTDARRKLAAALVDGVPLKIEGGEYQLCEGMEPHCRCGGCQKQRVTSRG